MAIERRGGGGGKGDGGGHWKIGLAGEGGRVNSSC